MTEVAQNHLDNLTRYNGFIKKASDSTMFSANYKLKDGFKIDFPIAKIYIFGTGGTGGWFVPKLVKILNDASAKFLVGKVEVILIDGDQVELKNVARQNFIVDDVGRNKAEVMCDRYAPHLVPNIDMFFVDKFVGNKTIISKYSDDHKSKFVDINAMFATPGKNETFLVLNFIDNAITRKTIHAKALTANLNRIGKNNILIFDVANNAYNGQVNFSYYGNSDVSEYYTAPSGFFLNYPEHLADLEGLKLENCADADVASVDQLFNANDFAASLIGNAVNALIQDKYIKNGLISFTTGNNIEVKTEYKLCNAGMAELSYLAMLLNDPLFKEWNLPSEAQKVIRDSLYGVAHDGTMPIEGFNYTSFKEINDYILNEFNSSFKEFVSK